MKANITRQQILNQAQIAKRSMWLYENSEKVMTALTALLEDTQHSEHSCGDKHCPVAAARRLVKKCPKQPLSDNSSEPK